MSESKCYYLIPLENSSFISAKTDMIPNQEAVQYMNPYFEVKRSIYVPTFKHALKLNWAVVRRMIMKNSITSPKHMWFDLYLKQMHSNVAFQNVFAELFLLYDH